ncbi:MAG TPA: glycerol-3-phosphate dehydrogenase [Candidatus Binataceae bacterium]|nr:glycerol-3-phosphate dehydrogenase [Candidatus Binataceae bacterium]
MDPETYPAQAGRAAESARLGAEIFDVAVIGGGINGAAIARDTALRGLNIALVDRGDFAGATSSHSSKLIHGGLRYLPQGQIRLVYHSLRERERLRRLTAPHLVGPIQFLFPFYAGRRPGRWAISAGLVLYDLFARTPVAERNRRLSSDEVRLLEPALDADGLSGGALYYDGWGDDARLTIENLVDTAMHRGTVVNYAEVVSLGHTGGRLAAAIVKDRESGQLIELRARCFVNAAGPWLDRVRMLDDPAARASMRLTKGVHLVVSAAQLPVKNALVLTDTAGRIVFVMPYEEWTLIGTTDTDYRGDPAQMRVDAEDIDYLIGVVNQAMPGVGLEREDVAYSFAGLRVLPANDGGQAPSAVAREEVVSESASGLISIGGGKLTSHRRMGEQIGAMVLRRLGRPSGPSPTRTMALPGARAIVNQMANGRAQEPVDARVWRERCPWLERRYGSRAAMVLVIAREQPELAQPLSAEAPVIGAEVVFAVRYEWARTVSDFLIRRTAIAWRNPPAAIASAAAVAKIMAEELGWDRARMEGALASFLIEMRSERHGGKPESREADEAERE